MVFGSKSERFIPVDTSQLSLFGKIIAEKEEAYKKHIVIYERKQKKKGKKKPVRSSIPAHFPRVEEIIEPKHIEEGAVKIGEEVTELLEITPLSVFVGTVNSTLSE